MKILIFSTGDFSVGTGSQIRGRLICEGLIDKGIKLFIVCKNIPPHFIDAGISFISTDIGYDLALDNAMRSFQPDFVYGITEGLADIVQRAAQKYGCKLIFDMHGIGIFEIIELGKGYGSRLLRLKNSFLWLCSMRKAQLITVANPTLVPLAKFIFRNSKILPIIGITDTTLFSPAAKIIPIGTDSSCLQVLYAGNYFKWQGVDLLLESIKLLLVQKTNIEFTILGSSGKNHFNFEPWKSLIDHPRVHFLDSINYADVPAYYQGADVLIIPRRWMLSTYFAFPQKIVDYMASGKLIIATDIGPHRWALSNPTCGILCPPNAKSIANAIVSALDEKSRILLGKSARKKAEMFFDYQIQTEKILKAFINLLDTPKSG